MATIESPSGEVAHEARTTACDLNTTLNELADRADAGELDGETLDELAAVLDDLDDDVRTLLDVVDEP